MPQNSTVQSLQSSWTLVTDKLNEWISAFFYYLPNIIVALIVVLVFIWLSRAVRRWTYKLLENVVSEKTARILLSQFFGGLIMLLGIILALSILGLDDVLKTILAGAGLAGLAVGLALQFPLSNTFSGVFLATENDISVGDWIETASYSGEIVEIDSRSTKIKEADNNIVVIPNKTLAENPYKNYALTKEVCISIVSAVPIDSDLKTVRQIALDTISRLYEDIDSQKIEFYYTDFKEGNIGILLRFVAVKSKERNAYKIKSDAIMAIKDAFEINNIKAPYPIRILHDSASNQG